MRFGSYFTGGGGADMAAFSLGFELAFGVEWDKDIAAACDTNLGTQTIVSAVEDVNPEFLPQVDWFHASPSCKNASNANARTGQQDTDMTSAQAIVRALRALQPRIFSLENVFLYRKFDAFQLILTTLQELGYAVDWRHLNSANYGVPQTRKRLALRAVRGWEGELPPPPKPVKWNGWYPAIEDIVWQLPDTQLAPWQQKRVPPDLREAMLFSSNGNHASWGDHHAMAGDPALAVTTQTLGRSRAVLLDTAQAGRNATTVDGGDPSMAVQAWHGRRPSHMPLAVMIEGRNTSDGFGAHPRDGDEPAVTVSAYDRPSHMPKAYLVKGQDYSGEDGIIMADENSPAFTVQGSRANVHRAILFSDGVSKDHKGNEYGNTSREGEEPSMTVTANGGPYNMLFLPEVHVKALDARCLARFQDFPDSYALPDKKKLAAIIVGNAVPRRLLSEPMRPILEALDFGS